MLGLNLSKSADSPLQLLCLGAHSDDIEIGCGGTVMSLLEQLGKCAVRWVVFSGNEDRSREARQSAEAFLARAAHKEIVVKAFRDGFFPFHGVQIKEEFESLKQDFNPDLIFTHHLDDRHQDHRLISDLTWNTFRNHLILEYEIAKYDGDLGRPNFYVSLSESISQRKIEILTSCFQSQRPKQWFDEEVFRAVLRLRGMEANSPSRYAEAFHSRKAVLVASHE